MSKVNRHRINRAIEMAVYEFFPNTHELSDILARRDLITKLQEISDTNIEAALAEGYDEGCHDTIKDVEDDLIDYPNKPYVLGKKKEKK